MKLTPRERRLLPRRRSRITTPRLTIRMLERDDITEFVRYRNLPTVARFQDWPLPFTRDLAHELVDELETLTGPTPGTWVQLAVEWRSELVGDVAVWLDEPGQFALVGYTLAPEFQGQGFAVEAVGAVVDHLFSRSRVHRIAATLDPRNLASARVAEQCGFEYVGTARSAALARGEWTDDTRFSLLADDRRAWKRRPRQAPRSVQLTEIDVTLVPAVASASVSFSQRGLVKPNAVVMSEVAHQKRRCAERAILADGAVVGHVVVSDGATADNDGVEIQHLMVAFENQRRGIGRRVIELLADDARSRGIKVLTARWDDDVVGGPERFFTSLGFRSDRVKSGRRIGRLEL